MFREYCKCKLSLITRCERKKYLHDDKVIIVFPLSQKGNLKLNVKNVNKQFARLTSEVNDEDVLRKLKENSLNINWFNINNCFVYESFNTHEYEVIKEVISKYV